MSKSVDRHRLERWGPLEEEQGEYFRQKNISEGLQMKEFGIFKVISSLEECITLGSSMWATEEV